MILASEDGRKTYANMIIIICPAMCGGQLFHEITDPGIAVLTIIPFTGFGASMGLAALPLVYFAWLALTILLYMVLATLFKKIFIKRYRELL